MSWKWYRFSCSNEIVSLSSTLKDVCFCDPIPVWIMFFFYQVFHFSSAPLHCNSVFSFMINYHNRGDRTPAAGIKESEIRVENSKLLDWLAAGTSASSSHQRPTRRVNEWFERLDRLTRGKSTPNVAQKWLNFIIGVLHLVHRHRRLRRVRVHVDLD